MKPNITPKSKKQIILTPPRFCTACNAELFEDENYLCTDCSLYLEEHYSNEQAYSEHIQQEVTVLNHKTEDF